MSKKIEELFADALMQETAKKMKDIVTSRIGKLEEEMLAKISDIKIKADTRLDDLNKKLTDIPSVVNFGTTEKPKRKIVHKAFNKIIKVLQSTKRIHKNIMLVGSAGGGKNVLCSDVANALNLEYYPMSVGLQTTKSDLLGFINAHGEYVTTPVRQAFENGGVLLLDEFDASHAGVVTILNSLLANDVCSFPDKIINKHKDFICIVACNTYGKGGSIDYIGRNRLDGATLDRFITIDVEYDDNLEEKLTNNKEWLKIIRKMRKNIEKFGLKVIVSPRASMQGADLLESGFDIEEVLEMVIYKGIGEDAKQKITQDIDFAKLNKNNVEEDDEKDKKREINSSKPIFVEINTEEGYYNVSNIEESVTLYATADWEGDFTIYISSAKEWVKTIFDDKICLNFGRNKLTSANQNATLSIVDKLITQLQTFGHSIRFDNQSVKLLINHNGSEYVFNFGEK